VNDELPLFVSLKRKKHVSNTEILVKPADGSMLTLLVSSAPIISPDGRITSAVATIVDITRLKSAENALQEAKGQAEMYLDLMGHDINNLNQVGIGFLELALDELHSRGRLEPGDQLLLEKAMETQINSSKLIENVRKIQKSREGGLRYKALDISYLLEKIKEYHSSIPDRTVTIRFSPVKHCYVNANDLIWDVFTNLVGNAIKHSPPGRPLEIDMGIKKVTVKGKDLYKITIEDNGPGIPDELKGRLFTRFRKGKTKTSGRGLGLYLVKTLLEDFSGSVSVEDRVKGDYNKGTRFTVLLPAVPGKK
jgi:signal transduction histidine kinase